MDISLTIDQLPDTAEQLVLKLGSQRRKLTQIKKFEYCPPEEEILDCLRSFGFGSDYPFARLMWYDVTGRKCVRSLSVTEELEEEPQTITAKLVDGMLEMASEMRRFQGTITETLITREKTLENVLEKLISSREANMVERQIALTMQRELEYSEFAAETDYKTQAIAALSNAANTWAQSQTKNMTPEMMSKLILANPEYIEHALEDEKLTKLIAEKIAAKTLKV